MGRTDCNLIEGLPSELGDSAATLIHGAASIDGAILVFDADDNIAWVNDRQRALMPCSEYIGRSYSQLFWEAHGAGYLGHAAARKNPGAWLEIAIVERSTSIFTQTVNEYAGVGRVVMSNRRLESGWTIQIRHPAGDVDFQDPEAVLFQAVSATRDAMALRKALDRQSVGVGILGRGSRLIYANGALRDIVAGAVGLASSAGQSVGPVHPDDAAAWAAALTHALCGGDSRVVLRTRGGRVALAATLTVGEQQDTAIILAASLRQHLPASAAAWLEEMGLRAGELDVIGMLLGGNSTQAIAARRGSTQGTVQAQIGHARTALRHRAFLVDGPGQIVALALQLSAITRAPNGAT